MKIVQSYWSLPTKNNDKHENNERTTGGWLSERTHAMSLALSCLKCKQLYPEIELYTDESGHDFLADIDTNSIVSVNAGITGGNDLEFFKTFGSAAFSMVNRNKEKFRHVKPGKTNVIFEQLYFYLLAQSRGLQIGTLLDNVTENSTDLVKFSVTPMTNKYVHAIGYAKQNPVSCNHVGVACVGYGIYQYYNC
ncbi:hypothetical protein SAMN04487996_12032 [Dyadobacter soli]|uniref:DUF6734 domain-containing protein n=1 Tax=Dyadobacter soli TaxID=659014 RepID=A0A1G7VD97_9BACT|nr:DUF6734 family protein [Dyadobacter soli]SDG57329.1 hypothetical protein SAMN04487996_12032 [Dyadobacter soli]